MNLGSIENFVNQKVLIYGDFMVDKYIDGSVNRISPEAPVPVLEVHSSEKRPGGAGNVAKNIRSLGADVQALSCIGDDENGNWLYNELLHLSVGIDYLCREKTRSTISKSRIVSKHQQFIRLDEEAIAPPPDSFVARISDNIDSIFDGVTVLIITDYGKGAVTPVLSQLLIQTARNRNIPVVVDPKGSDYSKYFGATICTPNTRELEIAVGREVMSEDDILHYAEKLCQKLDFEYLAVTRSEKGISLIKRAGPKTDFHVKPKEVIDVTGAGDTVVSVLALGLASGIPIEDCCVLANQAASLVISKFGVACVTISELVVDSILNSGMKHIDVDNASRLASHLRQAGKKSVFTNGCFDIIHAGHVASFRQAREFGDVLFVGMNSDASVKRLKGNNRPVMIEKDRLVLLCALTVVDYVIIFDDDDPSNLIRRIRPDVTVKGKDWENKYLPERVIIQDYGGRMEFIEMEKGLSTTSIIQKIKVANFE